MNVMRGKKLFAFISDHATQEKNAVFYLFALCMR